MERVRGFIDLVFDVVDETSNLVERTHDEVVERSLRRFAPVEPARAVGNVVTGIQGAIAATVFKSIRGVNGLTRLSVNAGIDVAESALKPDKNELATPMQSSAAGSVNWCIDYLQSSLNGLWGDYLSRHNSALDPGMTLRQDGRAISLDATALANAFEKPTNKLCVFVHGLASTEWLWTFSSAHHYDGDTNVCYGSRLCDDLGFTPVYIRYNTGKHISDNGQQLAALLDTLVKHFPVPVEEIALVGHSMGGLVARSAASYGRDKKLDWTRRLAHVACIGAPNLGAPLEKGVNLLTGALLYVDAAAAQVSRTILNSRSSGIKDLRYGYTLGDEWQGTDTDAPFSNARLNVPLPDDVPYYFIAAVLTKNPDNPVGKLIGDLLVRQPSASGNTANPRRRIPFTSGRNFAGLDHIQIVNHPDVYQALREMFEQRVTPSLTALSQT